jgi:hypothetical protein
MKPLLVCSSPPCVKNLVRQPGFEPGFQRWQRRILPLDDCRAAPDQQWLTGRGNFIAFPLRVQ